MSVANCNVTHVPTGKTLSMPMIIKTFEYDVSPSFSKTMTYGRMDPIFTYQHTVRSFTAVLATPGGGTTFTAAQREVFVSSGILTPNDFDGDTVVSTITARYLPRIADLFKLMYPLYGNSDGIAPRPIAAAPLLRLDLEGVTHQSEDVSSTMARGVLFVPETFKVTSIVDSSQVGVVIGSAEDIRFTANAKGYVITLGGTVLHENNYVGMYNHEGEVVFGQGADFPFATDGTANLFASPTTPSEDVGAGEESAPPGSPAANQQAQSSTGILEEPP